MRPSPVRGTLARLWEGLFLSLAGNISVFSISDARFPPYFFRTLLTASIPILFILGYKPSNPTLILLSLGAIGLIVLSIPLITYLSLKKTEYRLEGTTLNKEETLMGKNEESLNLSEVEDVYVNKGLVGSY